MSQDNFLYLLSDATGETAETIINAAITQFRKDDVRVKRLGHVRTEEQVREVLDTAKQKHQHALIFYTFVDRDLSAFTEDECDKRNIDCLDLISPVLHKLTKFFGHSPEGKPGLFHEVGEEYFQRMEAMEFALKNDDGQSFSHLQEADMVLVGISRTSKTPLSIYLSCRGYKVVNIPLVMGIPIPPPLLKVDPSKVACLFLDRDQLVRRREIRVKTLGVKKTTDYVDRAAVKKELQWARSLCRDNGWAVVHVTGKSVEEIAHEVLVKLDKK
jgi:regulator of PEP synthase PpsR (kinase-PPPase family)